MSRNLVIGFSQEELGKEGLIIFLKNNACVYASEAE